LVAPSRAWRVVSTHARPPSPTRRSSDLHPGDRFHFGIADLFDRLAAGNAVLQYGGVIECGPDLLARRIQNIFAGHLHGVSPFARSEEHTSELQSRDTPVCRLLLEKKKIR